MYKLELGIVAHDNSKEVAWITLKFDKHLLILFLKKPINFGDDLSRIVVLRDIIGGFLRCSQNSRSYLLFKE